MIVEIRNKSIDLDFTLVRPFFWATEDLVLDGQDTFTFKEVQEIQEEIFPQGFSIANTGDFKLLTNEGTLQLLHEREDIALAGFFKEEGLDPLLTFRYSFLESPTYWCTYDSVVWVKSPATRFINLSNREVEVYQAFAFREERLSIRLIRF